MTRRLPLIAGWLIAGHAAAAGLFWALLQVPESSSLMLVISATLALLAVLAVVWTVGGALAAWRPEATPGRAMARGLRHLAAIVLGALVFALVWWLTEKGAIWHAQYRRAARCVDHRAHRQVRDGSAPQRHLLAALVPALGPGPDDRLVAGRVGGPRRSARARERPMAGERAQPAPLARRHGARRPRHRAAVASRLLAAGEDLDWGGAVVRDGEVGADRPGRDVRVGVDLACRHAAAKPIGRNASRFTSACPPHACRCFDAFMVQRSAPRYLIFVQSPFSASARSKHAAARPYA